MATEAAKAIKREREWQALLARLDALADKIDAVYAYVQAQEADQSASPRRSRKTKEAETS